jgi:hypothetical protein
MSDEKKFINRDTGKEIEIPVEGSLGLLALGDIAVKPWRQKRIDTGYEKELIERIALHEEELKKKMEEFKRKREQRKNEQEKS